MPKAFKQDSDEAPAVGARSQSRYITPEGLEKLKAEMERLWKVDRPRVTAEVSAAAALGDRSENAEYIYGKKRLREIDHRIKFLTERLDDLVVVREPPAARDRVFFGAFVTVEDEDGAKTTYRLVGADEFDVKSGKVSVESPLAKGLLGKRRGDVVSVARPKGPAELTIVGIRYGKDGSK